MGSSKEEYKSRPGDTERYKNMTTKGAGAEGARPLCGGGRRPHSCFCILSVSLGLDLYSSLDEAMQKASRLKNASLENPVFSGWLRGFGSLCLERP